MKECDRTETTIKKPYIPESLISMLEEMVSQKRVTPDKFMARHAEGLVGQEVFDIHEKSMGGNTPGVAIGEGI